MTRLNIVKMAMLPKLIYGFNPIGVKSPAAFRMDKLILKFIWKRKRTQIAEMTLKKKNKVEDSHFAISSLITKLQ